MADYPGQKKTDPENYDCTVNNQAKTTETTFHKTARLGDCKYCKKYTRWNVANEILIRETHFSRWLSRGEEQKNLRYTVSSAVWRQEDRLRRTENLQSS